MSELLPCLNAEEIKSMAREIHSIPGMGWIHTDVHEQIITELVKQLHTRAQPIAPAPGVGESGRTDAERLDWLQVNARSVVAYAKAKCGNSFPLKLLDSFHCTTHRQAIDAAMNESEAKK